MEPTSPADGAAARGDFERDFSRAVAALREQLQPPSEGGSGQFAVGASSRQGSPTDAATIAEFRSMAAAARDEMLSGLTRPGRGLEAMSQHRQVSPCASIDGEQYLQQGPRASALVELRHEFVAHQVALAELRRDLASEREISYRGRAELEHEVARLKADWLTVSAVVTGLGGSNPSLCSQESVGMLTRRIELLEDLKPQINELRGDFLGLREIATSDQLERTRDSTSACTQVDVDQLAAQVDAEVERRTSDMEVLRRYIDEVQTARRASAASDTSGGDTALAIRVQEVAEGLSLERASREAQVVSLHAQIVEEIQCRITEFVGEANADFRKEAQQCFEVLAAELRAELQGGMASMCVSPGGRDVGHPQLPEDLKESLEELVEKVNKTLRPHASGEAQADTSPTLLLSQDVSPVQFRHLRHQQQQLQQPQQPQQPRPRAASPMQRAVPVRALSRSTTIPQVGAGNPSTVANANAVVQVRTMQRFGSVVIAPRSVPAGIMTPVVPAPAAQLAAVVGSRTAPAMGSVTPVMLPTKNQGDVDSEETNSLCSMPRDNPSNSLQQHAGSMIFQAQASMPVDFPIGVTLVAQTTRM